MSEPDQPAPPDPSLLGPRAAAALVFGSSAAVLVVELVALRLLAPYLGLTLEINTLVIGMALVSIAAGSWWGGKLADTVAPRRLLGPLLLGSGVAVAVTPFLVRGSAEVAQGALLVMAAAATIFVPAALLSAVTPVVTKLRLTTLAETGSVVGGLSGIGTVGAVVGTVLTGFVLVSRVPVSVIMVGLGVLLVVAAVVVEATLRTVGGVTAAAVAVVGLGAVGAVAGPGGCDAETTYHCADVVTSGERPSGRELVLDGQPHSFVDLDDPTHLEYRYTRALASAIETQAAPGPVTAHHLGAGGLTIPRWLREVRPGSTSVVSEIDGGVLDLDRERLGFEPGDDVELRVEDGRVGLDRVADGSQDVVVGDAFGGVSVPWHLTTREAVGEVRRILADDGVYVLNLIDYGPLDFARAELATLREVFPHVVLTGEPADLSPAADPRGDGGNLVAVASGTPLDAEALAAALTERETEWGVAEGDDLDAFVGDAEVLTDDHAPVDQLLTPYRVATA
ncbi:fused MFS/spermidine synthase [Nocardioides litoris]|uniref:fused MFS/spermidine synthase n=1 Tax=Nocardioides litoris TaxID=1926648 RepID=UPI001B869781|nr:fused MFS/spermidine synthase [Nocardioides litoris]